MKQAFADKIVVITGGASGIGKSIAIRLAGYGATIIIIDRIEKTGITLVDTLTDGGYRAVFKKADVAVIDEAKKVFAAIKKQYGQIDYVFNSAGEFMAGEIRDTPIENWHMIISNNIFAVMNGAHFAYQAMLPQGNGHIVNFGSAAGLFPVPAMGIYGSTKFAIVGLTHALRNEAKDLGVKVSVVCPTIVDTPLYDRATYNNLKVRKALKRRDSLQTPEVAAKKIIVGVVKNKATIHTAISTKVGWTTYMLAPWLYNLVTQRVIRKYRASLRLKSK